MNFEGILNEGSEGLRNGCYSGCRKKRSGIQTFFSTTTYAALPSLGVFKPGALHPVTPAPIKAPALRVVGDAEHYYGKRIK
jgi:hypothetical protein